jgi:hypothetical protein
VHFIKKHMWFLETALALLEGDEVTEYEHAEDLIGMGKTTPAPDVVVGVDAEPELTTTVSSTETDTGSETLATDRTLSEGDAQSASPWANRRRHRQP